MNDDTVSKFLIDSSRENKIIKLEELVELIRKERFPYYSNPEHPSEKIVETKKVSNKPKYLPFGTILTKDNFIPNVWCHVSDMKIDHLDLNDLKSIHLSKIIKMKEHDSIYPFVSHSGPLWKYAIVAKSSKELPQPWGDYKPYRWFRHISDPTKIARLVSDTFDRKSKYPSKGMYLFDFGKSFSGHDGLRGQHMYDFSEEAEALRILGSGHLYFELGTNYKEIDEPADTSPWEY